MDIPWIDNACEHCGTPIFRALPAGVDCGNCQQRPPPFTMAFAPLHYDFPVDAVIKSLKFDRKLFLAPGLASLLLPWLLGRAGHYDVLLPVPLHQRRHATRGFNQAYELARHLGSSTGLPVSRCVARTRNTNTQSGLDAATRKKNMIGAFGVVSAPPGRSFLVVDDVMTTGETCRALASVLLDAGVERVDILTVARASF